jgi:hypothetical protein
MAGDDVRVVHAGVALIGRDFPHIKVLGRGIHEVRQEFGITGILVADFNRCNHIGFDTAHQVHLDPGMLLSHDTIFVIEPADKARGGETQGIDRKIRFDHFEWQTTFNNQASKDGCQVGVLQGVED